MSSPRPSRLSQLFARITRSSSSTPAQPPPSERSIPQVTVSSTASNTTVEPFPQGLKIVAEGIDPVVDIVAVHGLDGHRDKTWTADNGVHWLRDLLPHDIPRARIFCWGYNANTHGDSNVSRLYLYDHACNLISDLCRKRKLSNSMERPIIFVAHSLGGIIVKSALIDSDAAREGALKEHRSIKVSTYGIIFLGTPHQGGNGVQLGKLLVNIASVFVATNDQLLKHLERDSEWLLQQLGQYSKISSDFRTKFAFEEYETPIALGHSIMVVPRASAVVPGQADAEPFAIHANHINMVKYMSRQDNGYDTIMEHLQIMANDAAEKIRQRWEAEKRVNEARSESGSVAFTISFSLSEVTEVDYFVAREEELTQIHKVLGEGSGRRTAVIHGLGGMGKTQLAVAYVKRHQDDYSAVFWLNARDEASLKQGFARVAERILREHPSVVYVKNAVEGHDLDETVQAVKRWFNAPKNSRWLIVYDNYDNPMLGREGGIGKADEADEDAEEGTDTVSRSYDIRPFLPDTYHGAVLATTRSSRVELGRRIRLGELRDVKDSLDILSHTSNRQGLHEDDAAIELATKLDGLPLALSTAGTYLRNMTTTFAEYLQMYTESWLRLQTKTPSLSSYEDRALYSTWDLSYTQIERQNTASATLLQLWAYFDHEDLWFELLREGRSNGPTWFQELMTDTLEFDETVRVLCDYGLVEADATWKERGTESRGYGYGMHSCVHMWTIHLLNKVKNDDLAQLAMRCVGSHVPATTEQGYWVVQRRLMQHAGRCSEMIIRDGMRVADGEEWILHKLGGLLFDQDRLSEAEAMYERALLGKEEILGPDDTSTLDTANSLGNLYHAQGRLEEAERMYQRALKGFEVVFEPAHESTLNIANNLGYLYTTQGRLKDAETMYQQALEGKKKAFGPDHASTLITGANFGTLYRAQGLPEEAERMYQWALKGVEIILGSAHTSTLHIINNLGSLYAEQKRLKDAEAMYQRALKGYDKALGPHHASTLRTLDNLVSLYSTQGRRDGTEAVYQQALKGKEKMLGLDNTSILDTTNENAPPSPSQSPDAPVLRPKLAYKTIAVPSTIPSTWIINGIKPAKNSYLDTSTQDTMSVSMLGSASTLGSDHTTLDIANKDAISSSYKSAWITSQDILAHNSYLNTANKDAISSSYTSAWITNQNILAQNSYLNTANKDANVGVDAGAAS